MERGEIRDYQATWFLVSRVTICSMTNKKIIIGNWKMAPSTMKEAKVTFNSIKKIASKLPNAQTIICPPFVYLSELKKTVSGNRCVLGAQDSFWDSKEKAHTGEVSPEMLSGLGIKYVILGHSEKRALGESDEIVNKKVNECLKEGLIVVLCVGESQRDEHGEYTKFIKKEIIDSLKKIQKKYLNNLMIAYEPIWAIGKSATRVASPEDALEVSILIKKVLAGMFNKDIAMKVPILYGGSVNPDNSKSFLTDGEMDGLLVGRASLDANKFGKILKIANQLN